MRSYRRLWVCAFLFMLTAINYADRVALSVAVTAGGPGVRAGTRSRWAICCPRSCGPMCFALILVGLLVDRFGGKIVNACGIGLWSLATVVHRAGALLPLRHGQPGGHGHGRVDVLAGVEPDHPREWFPATERAVANAIFGAGGGRATLRLEQSAFRAIVGSLGAGAGGFIVAGSIELHLAIAMVDLLRSPRARELGCCLTNGRRS